MLLYQILVFTIHVKIDTKTMNLKYQLQHGMKSLNYLVDHIRFQIFKAILSISSRNMKQLLIILNPFRTAKAATKGNQRLCLKSKPQVKCH